MKTQNISLVVIVIVVLSLLLASCAPAAPAEAAEEAEEVAAEETDSNHWWDPFRGNEVAEEEVAEEPAEYEEAAEPAAEEPMYELEADEAGPASVGMGGGEEYKNPLPTAAPYRQPEPPEDMFFEDYGVNPFLDTEDDQLSTFSMDVDTGSFTLARNYLKDGYIPPNDAVRVEEFINYFYQGYPNPGERQTFGVNIDGAPSPFTETERYHMMRVGIQGYDISALERKPVSLTFVIDVSGSMYEGNRLELVKDSLALLVSQLDASDQVGIVAYSNDAWIVLSPTRGDHTRTIKKAIETLYPTNSTNAEAGLVLGYDMAARAFMPGAVNRVVLCSDGVANVGATGPGSIWERIRYQASEGINLTSVGVGMGNYNDELLEQLADNGEGFYAYIDNMDEAERLFLHDLVGTMQVIAMDAKVQVDFNPEVVSRYRLVGYENRAIADEDFRNDQVDAAEIGAGHSVTALYEIKLHSGARGEIATVHLRWQDPDSGRAHETAESFYTQELEDSFRQADPYFQLDVLVAEFAEILRQSYWTEGDIDQVLEYTRPLTRLLEMQELDDLIEMMEMADHLSG